MTQNTKEKILGAAKMLFVQGGFAGTSMGKIAKLAKVNHSLLFHHFGNKEMLWLAVKLAIVEEYKQSSVILPDHQQLDCAEFLNQLVHNSYHFYRSNPDLLRILNWQRLEATSNEKIGIQPSSEMRAWLDAIEYYQKANQLQPDYPSHFIMTFILGLISSLVLDPNCCIGTEEARADYLDFCSRCIASSFLV